MANTVALHFADTTTDLILALLAASRFQSDMTKAMDLALAIHSWAEDQSSLPDEELSSKSHKALKRNGEEA